MVAQSVAAVVAKTVASIASVASVEEIGVSLCLGFRLGGSDGRKSENYELKGEKRVKKKCILGFVKGRGSVRGC